MDPNRDILTDAGVTMVPVNKNHIGQPVGRPKSPNVLRSAQPADNSTGVQVRGLDVLDFLGTFPDVNREKERVRPFLQYS
jgi:hypothetical protein